VYKRWHEYKDLLDADKNYLNEDFPQWLEDSDRNVPDTLQDAQHKLENTRVGLKCRCHLLIEVTNIFDMLELHQNNKLNLPLL